MSPVGRVNNVRFDTSTGARPLCRAIDSPATAQPPRYAAAMRAVIQRVTQARVDVDGETAGAIGRGLLVLLGVGRGDGPGQARWMADKIAGLRIFEDDRGKMNRSVADVEGAVLVVSQFTLWGDCQKGRRPSFVEAAPPEHAQRLYEQCLAEVSARGIPVASGRFRTHMEVALINDGPVTLIVESPPV